MTRYLQQKTLFPPQVDSRVVPNLGIIVVIPCCDEEELLFSLLSLKKCDQPDCSVEVIIVVNNSERANEILVEHNFKTYHEMNAWGMQNSSPEFKFHFLYHPDLPHKHAGVGLARKIGMDEACWRLERAKNPKGIIVCFDADSKCETNYLTEIEKHFGANPKTTACGIQFEHPLFGIEFDKPVYNAITLYELHLRYYVEAQRYSGFPFAYQTIGSSMAVRCDAYQLQGGMNKRKAGEDFYFLHKFIELGSFTEIHTTRVIPSPRPSHRVPFGTGKAVGDLLKNNMQYDTYAFEHFEILKSFFEMLPSIYSLNFESIISLLPKPMAEFLKTVNFEKKWSELHRETSNFESFLKRFYRWFNAFMLMKFVHFSRDNFHPNVSVTLAANKLLSKTGQTEFDNEKDLLLQYRKLDSGA
jgi:hypothetical protein